MGNTIIPHEIINIIIQQIPHDKIYCSYVSKIWYNVCKYNYEMNKNTNNIPDNCAYDLNLWLKEFGKINHKKAIYTSHKDINIRNVLVQYAMDNGFLYGNHLKLHTFNKVYSHSKFEKITGENGIDAITKNNTFIRTIKINMWRLFCEYCEYDILNKYTIYVIKLLLMYYGYTYLMLTSIQHKPSIISKYILEKYNGVY